MNQKVSEIKEKALKLIEEAKDKNALEDVRVKFLGKKGELTTILRSMGNLSKEERPAMGKLVNEAKKAVEEKLDEVVADLKQKEKEMKFVGGIALSLMLCVMSTTTTFAAAEGF